MKTTTTNDRLARLEEREKVLSDQQRETNQKLDTLLTRFDRYEARWGGVMMIVSALVAVALAFKRELMDMIRGR